MVSHFKRKRLEELRQRIKELKRQPSDLILCAIIGIAGCGKTELAKAYAWELSGSPHAFRWRLDPDPDSTQNNSSEVSYQHAFFQLLHNFRVPTSKAYDAETPEEMHQRLNHILWMRIRQFSSWIVIFDNAGSKKDIQQYLPPKELEHQGTILITSQQSHFLKGDKLANFCVNQGLDPEEAVQLLKELSSRVDEDEKVSLNLVKAMDYLPLGIRVAGYYMYEESEITFETYIHLLRREADEGLIHLIGRDDLVSQATENYKQPETLQAALELSVKKLKQNNTQLAEVLEYVGYLSNEEIPLDLLRELCQRSDGELRTLLVGKNNYSLLTYETNKRTCYLHRTTQVVLLSLSSSPTETIRDITAVILKIYPYDLYSMERIKACQKVSAHLLTLYQHIRSDPKLAAILAVEQLQLTLTLGKLAYRFGQYFDASQYFQEAWRIAETSRNVHLAVHVEILRYLGHTKWYLIEYKDARMYLEQSLKIGQDIYESTDWNLALIYNLLGDILRLDPSSTRREALQIFKEAEQICENNKPVSRDSELQLAFSYTGIGRCLLQMHNFHSAMNHFNQALRIYLQYLGDAHPYIAHVYQHLGILGLAIDPDRFVYIEINYSESRKHLEKSLSIYKEAYGSVSYSVAKSYHWISRLLYVSEKNEDWNLALQYHNQEIEIYIKIFGSMYQDLIESHYWKGKILQKLNRDREAINAYQEVLKISQQYPGKWINLVRESERILHEIVK